MKIISSKYTYIDSEYKKDVAVAFDKNIVKIATLDELKAEFPNAQLITYPNNSVIYPGFINSHVHLEFSANRATLKYGDFISWLYSVIENREELVSKLNEDLIKEKAQEMLKSGVTTFGAISSYGAELEMCAKLEQRVIFFNEVIGSNPAAIDALFNDFKNRVAESMELKSDTLIPAIAIHSPYSVHPFLIREVLNIAKSQNLITTAHFLESQAEREWLESSSGNFLDFFKNFSNTTQAVTTIEEFLNAFKNIPTLFTHAVQIKESEIETINKNGHSVIHCPRSNRLLGCGRAPIEYIDRVLLGTDGLSSNYSLNILEEMRSALNMHFQADLNKLATRLIESVTTTASNALNLKIGKIEPEYWADFAIFTLPDDLKYKDKGSLALHTIINCESADSVYIGGEELRVKN